MPPYVACGKFGAGRASEFQKQAKAVVPSWTPRKVKGYN